jgi:hypothetical protein
LIDVVQGVIFTKMGKLDQPEVPVTETRAIVGASGWWSSLRWKKCHRADATEKRECMGIEPTESFIQTLRWF